MVQKEGWHLESSVRWAQDVLAGHLVLPCRPGIAEHWWRDPTLPHPPPPAAGKWTSCNTASPWVKLISLDTELAHLSSVTCPAGWFGGLPG